MLRARPLILPAIPLDWKVMRMVWRFLPDLPAIVPSAAAGFLLQRWFLPRYRLLLAPVLGFISFDAERSDQSHDEPANVLGERGAPGPRALPISRPSPYGDLTYGRGGRARRHYQGACCPRLQVDAPTIQPALRVNVERSKLFDSVRVKEPLHATQGLRVLAVRCRPFASHEEKY